MDLSFFEELLNSAGPQVATLLALIAANTLLGIAVAIKQGEFEWRQVADFYTKDVIPKFFGYIAVLILARFASLEFLGPDLAGSIEGGLLTLAWLAIVVSFGGDILGKVAALGLTVVERVPGVSAPEA